MTNRGYPDDDGSRDPGGVHGEGPQSGVSLCDVQSMTRPATITDHLHNDLLINNPTDSDGTANQVMTPRYPVDGDANSNPTHRSTADYPAWTSAG